MLDGPFLRPDMSRALEGTRTPNLLIRSQMLYPLSYERRPPTLEGKKPTRTLAVQETGHQLEVHHGFQLPARWYTT